MVLPNLGAAVFLDHLNKLSFISILRSPQCYIPSPKVIDMVLPNMGAAVFLDHLNKLSFIRPKESPYEISVQLADWFQRRRCLKMLTVDGRRSHWYTISSPRSLRLRCFEPIKLLFFKICNQRVCASYRCARKRYQIIIHKVSF